MTYTMHYDSPLGKILLAADEEGMTGVWFEAQKYFAAKLPPENEEGTMPVLGDACRWLDVYFSGREPDFTPKLHLIGSDFRQAVWALLLQIPYGQTTTYGALAKQLAEINGGKRVSAQAVGGAVGHNPVSIIVPCPSGGGQRRQPDRLRGRHRQEDVLADAGKRRGGKSLPITKSRPSRRDDLLLLYVSFTCSGCTRRWPWRQPCLRPWP